MKEQEKAEKVVRSWPASFTRGRRGWPGRGLSLQPGHSCLHLAQCLGCARQEQTGGRVPAGARQSTCKLCCSPLRDGRWQRAVHADASRQHARSSIQSAGMLGSWIRRPVQAAKELKSQGFDTKKQREKAQGFFKVRCTASVLLPTRCSCPLAQGCL